MSGPVSDAASADDKPLTRKRAGGLGRLAVVLAAFVGLYLIIAYAVLPMFWVHYAHRHPAIDETPGITTTGDDHPGDPINVALIGSEADIKRVMQAGGWFSADPLGLKSDLKIAADTVLERPYETAPVSNLFLWGRREDLAFEQPVGDDPRQRHHARFWKSAKLDADGRPAWMGSATYDQRVGLSHTTGQITHHIASDVDAERDHLFECLKPTNELIDLQVIDGFHKVREGHNGGGDPWHTDGRLFVGTLETSATP
jgi:hypothetical protein